MEDPGQPQGPIFEQALRLVLYELEIDGSTNQDELQRWLVSLRENPRQYKSIFSLTKGHDEGEKNHKNGEVELCFWKLLLLRDGS